MTETTKGFRSRLTKRTGLSDAAVTAAWPDWWSEAAEASPSAQAELRFSLARKLGLDPRSLLNEGDPAFIWTDAARFKGFRGDDDRDRPVLASFGTAVSRILLQATPPSGFDETISAARLRASVLRSRHHVGLFELLSISWALGIPVIHLRVYPLSAKRMSAMSVRVGSRYAVLMARDAHYPAPLAFHLAHELGHILQNHLADGAAIVDLSSLEDEAGPQDEEEKAADSYAIELLTGRPELQVSVRGEGRNARELAAEAVRVGASERIEPGTVALAYGHATGYWDTTIASFRHIYNEPTEAWRVINDVARRQLTWSEIPDESGNFLAALMGGVGG